MPTRNNVVQLNPARVHPRVLGNYILEFLHKRYPPPGHKILTEHRFTPERKWRFDIAVMPERVAVELMGGIWIRGARSHGMGGYAADAEKFLFAAALGWVVVPLPYDLIRAQLEWVLSALALTIEARSEPRHALRRSGMT